MNIIQIDNDQRKIEILAHLQVKLWPHHPISELIQETTRSIAAGANHAFFMAMISEAAVGFIHVSIRHEYVNGSSTNPCGFIEGIYVEPIFRRQNLARALVQSAMQFVQENGCTEIGTDVAVENQASYLFHQKLGFNEQERVIYLFKKII